MKKKRFECLVVVFLLLVGSFLRLFRINETMMFQGDQGRDAIVVKRMLKDFDLTLLGPVTSVGNMYLGPFYYYFMAPFLAFSYPDPIGPAVGVALLDILALYLIYAVGKEVFSRNAGLVAMFVYAIMEVAVLHARFSWNPNLGSVMGLLVFWFMYRFVKLKNGRYLIWATLAFAALTQLHYVALLGGIIIGVGLLASFLRRQESRRSNLWRSVFLSGGLYLLSFAPLIAFDLRHNHLIWNGFSKFLIGSEDHIRNADALMQMVWEWQGRSFQVLAQMMGSINGVQDRLIAYSTILGVAYLIYRSIKKAENNIGLTLMVAWIGGAIVGTSFYTDTVFDHYLSFTYSGLAILFGMLLSELLKMKRIGVVAVALVLSLYSWVNLSKTPAWANSGLAYTYYWRAADKILEMIPEGDYNLALLSESKDYKGMNYRYFFEVSKNPPQSYEDYENLDYLVIIDEVSTPEPLNQLIFEVQSVPVETMIDSIEITNGPRAFVYKVRK